MASPDNSDAAIFDANSMPRNRIDEERLEREMNSYQIRLDERTEECYQLAAKARSKGLDHTLEVEIPRANDLAGRTEKLLVDHLDGLEIAEDIRTMLKEYENDRETTAIKIAQKVAQEFKQRGESTVKSIDVGLRVGLAVLTEAVLVAPLEGISEVRLLSNADGSEFVSIHFAGPIRAAGGTGQALGVLIADMIRRDMNIGPYIPTRPQIERVKEEFGLYRGNLQYRPPPEEIEMIVTACPVMINGESTESIECSGFGHVLNIDEPRIRGGVLLVIGEGLCLKAPKVQKHTERLKVQGWEFISNFAEKKNKEDSSEFKSARVKPVQKFMSDIIAGRPVFGDPLERGGFRLRYGRGRASGLAAGSINPTGMSVMDDFLAVGTQMKIERPGKACAVTPCDELEGPWVILKDGRFLRLDDLEAWKEHGDSTILIWDNGEIALGYGEFMENNKELIPAAYCKDWWASELLEALVNDEDYEKMAKILGIDSFAELNYKDLHTLLRKLELDWETSVAISRQYGTSLPPPNNPWWADLPLEWVDGFLEILSKSIIDDGMLRIPKGAEGWSSESAYTSLMDEESNPNGDGGKLIFDHHQRSVQFLNEHGMAKTCVMLLGLAHHHDGDDLLITNGWEAMLEGFGFRSDGAEIKRMKDARSHLQNRLKQLEDAATSIYEESLRMKELQNARSSVRIAAETEARQKGMSIADTDRLGKEAMDNVLDEGPINPQKLLKARMLEDEHAIIGTLWLVRKVSDLRWENSVAIRIGARMGRPEKAAAREKPTTHSIFPVGTDGGPQRLLSVVVDKGNYNANVGKRTCVKCGHPSVLLKCHSLQEDGDLCRGRTEMSGGELGDGRRRGVLQNIKISAYMEEARISLGLDRLPKPMKGLKKLMSRDQTPEALEKGLLRASHGVPVFRDGTVRFDMSDVPTTHFTPEEIGVAWPRLFDLGYSHDIDGKVLENDQQMLELYPQDFIASRAAADFFLRTSHYIDDLLKKFYGLERYYNAETEDDLIGHLIIGLAPHTSGGMLGRIIGWTDSSGGYAHPLFHASKRRNCDGDEDAIMLLMDGLLNFSKRILPANRGGQMDAPLVLTTTLNPTEVDKEALNVDSGWYYPSAFYEATKQQPHPKEVLHLIDIVEKRLESVAAVRGYGFTHGTSNMNEGPALSAYKTLETMVDKMNGQIDLGARLRAVDVRNVASSVVRSHFLPDLRGNLLAFTRQKVRCVSCGHKYRRMPLAGHCIQGAKRSSRGLGAHGVDDSGKDLCKGNLALTVSEGAVRKYIKVTKHVMETYGVDNYTKQNVDWLSKSTDSLFSNDKAKQLSLTDFL